jgi:uncharacterized repeat protein (TIGR01451 family)
MEAYLHHSNKRLFWAAASAFLFCVEAAAQGPAICQITNGAVTPSMRAEGPTEKTGDIVLICSGGTPTAVGDPLPQGNITVFLNTAVTSRLMDATGASEAILMVDEPGSALPGAPSTQLACATPLTGCSITSNGGEPYDGTPGRPNIFEGVVSSNTVTFFGVPLTSPGNFGINPGGSEGARILRITNIRANASGLSPLLLSSGTPPAIQASVAISSTFAISSPPIVTVGFVQFGLLYQTRNAADTAVASSPSLSGCVAGSSCEVAVVRFQENFPTAFLSRAALPSNSIAIQQNVPGTIYNSESGFYNTSLATSNPNLATAGLADAGTRLKATFQGVPAGAQLWVAVYIGNNPLGAPAQLTANEAGPFSAVTPASSVSGILAAPLTVTNGSATAVWEVASGNPASIDTFDFPVFVVFPAGSSPAGTLTIQGSFAPNADEDAFPPAGEFMAQNATFPEPRFTSGPSPSLAIAETHSGSLSQGEVGASFTITVNNTGNATSGVVTVQDLLPSGVLTVTSMTGSGWGCILATLTCTRSDALAEGASYPQIFLTGNVLANAPAQFMDQLTVSGGGSATATVSDTEPIDAAPQLTSLLPSTALTNSSGFTLAAGGANIVSGASIEWTAPGGAQTTLPGAFIGSTQLQAAIPASLLTASGVAHVAILNPDGASSGSLPFTIMPVVSVSVNPASGAGAGQTFTFVYTDVNVASDLASAQAIINTSVTDASACYVWVTPGTGTIWLADNAGNWPSSLTLGSAGTLQNSQCAVNVGSSSGTLSGNTYTLNLAITFESGFSGLKNIYGLATNVAALSSGWQILGSWTAASSGPPVHAVSVSPSTGAGSTQTFTFVYTDSNGVSDLASAQALIDTSITSASACYVWVTPGTGTIWLAADAGTWPASQTVGSAGTLQNSQCAVNVGSSSGALSGNTYTLILAITFESGFSGLKNIYSQATSMGAPSSGWQTVGTWAVLGGGPAIQAVSVTPASGAGASQTFTFVYTDSNGASDLGSAQAIINTSITSVSACYVWVTPGTATIWLAGDSGNWPASMTLGTAGTLQNSECAVNVGSSSGALSGNTYTLNLTIIFQSGFTGAKNIYSQATGMGVQSSGWQTVGTWTAATGTTLHAVSVNPASGAGVSQTFSFVYTDSNGATDLASAQALINTSITSISSCYVWVTPGTGTIWLADNAGNWPASMTLGTAGTLQNSQCAVNVGSSSGALNGNTYTLNLAITFQGGSTGTKNIYSLATNPATLSSGWVSVGTWTP